MNRRAASGAEAVSRRMPSSRVLSPRRSIGAAAALALAAGVAHATSVPDFVRSQTTVQGQALLDAARAMPAERYGYAPDPSQMTFGGLVLHVAVGNYLFCSRIGGVAEPAQRPSPAGEPKESLIRRLQDSFEFCGRALAALDDTRLSEVLDVASVKMPRSMAILTLSGTWNTHLTMAKDYLAQTATKGSGSAP